MGIPGGANLLLAAGGDAPAYSIDQSLRFRGGQYLSKTFSSSGNRETNTLSLWCKRSYLSAFNDNNYTLVTADPNNNYDEIGFTQNYGNTESDEVWYRIQGGYYVIPNNLFRDISAWTHLVFRRDGTQSTAANRLRIYINGAEATYRATNYQPQNQVWGKLCHSCNHRIGTYDNTYQKFRGYMAELHLVDGQSLGPDSFGEYDDNGVWRPIAYDGTYGTNGIYMKFDPSASNGIGHDHSGNGHHFTATGFTTSGSGTDVMSDTPTTNRATWNPLKPGADEYNKANQFVKTGNKNAAYFGTGNATIELPASGSYYWEFTYSSGVGTFGIGNPFPANEDADQIAGYSPYSGWVYINGSANTNVGGGSSGDVLGYAVNMSTKEIKFYKNNSLLTTKTFSSAGPYAVKAMHVSGSGSDDIYYNQNLVYSPPSGYLPLSAANLPTASIAKPDEHFNIVTYTGNSASSRSITGVGFQPDFAWIKTTNANRDHFVYDVVRGSTNGNFYELRTSSTSAQGVPSSASSGLTGFTSDGFTVGSDASVNQNNDTYVAWCWKAGGTASSNTSGNVTSQVSANPTAGFSVVSYQSQSFKPVTVGHGLGAKPDFILIKNYDVGASWAGYHSSLGATKSISLNSTSQGTASADYFNNTEPTSTVFTVFDSTATHQYGGSSDLVAYCWTAIEGYSAFGKYIGNSSTDGPFVYLGFRPKFLLRKSAINAADDWVLQDSTRTPYNEVQTYTRPNQSYSDVLTSSETQVDFLANGFKVRSDNYKTNYSGATYIYAAFAENPFGGDNVSPVTAR